MNKTITINQNVSLRSPRNIRVIVLDGLDFFWDEHELEDMAHKWEQGVSLLEIANDFKRDPDEVLLALLHLGRQEKIGRRDGGILGGS
jgi:hypothetical protein